MEKISDFLNYLDIQTFIIVVVGLILFILTECTKPITNNRPEHLKIMFDSDKYTLLVWGILIIFYIIDMFVVSCGFILFFNSILSEKYYHCGLEVLLALNTLVPVAIVFATRKYLRNILFARQQP